MLRAGLVDGRPVPVGVSLPVPIRLWTLTGGAEYLPDEDAVLLPAVGAAAMSPLVRTDHPSRLDFTEEWWLPTAGVRLISTFYSDDRQKQVGSNGSASARPAGWSAISHPFNASTANRLAESVWARWTCSVTAQYGVPGAKVRNPSLMVASR